jgi:hypothetical protein
MTTVIPSLSTIRSMMPGERRLGRRLESLLEDDSLSTYKKLGLKFPLSGAGIEAGGRTTTVRLNYRNTREILNLGKSFLQVHDVDDDHVPLIAREAAGTGEYFRHFDFFSEEAIYTARCIKKWNVRRHFLTI